MNEFKNKKILFFTTNPDPYMKDTLERMGAEVDYYSERPNQNTLTKILIRINRNLIASRVNKYHDRILEETKTKEYDIIFFIRCEAFSRETLKRFKQYHPNARMVVFFWDSFVYNKNSEKVYDLFDRAFSFEKDDAEKYGISFLPLFYYDSYSNLPVRKEYKYKSLFIGTLHSDRYRIVTNIQDWLNKKGFNNYAWFYLSSKILLYQMILEDKQFKYKNRTVVKYKTLTLEEMQNLYSDSEIVIDVQSPKQIGLTMRTFETLGARRKLITTNKDIINYDFYNPNNILVIDRDDKQIPEEFVTRPYQQIDDIIYKKYSLSSWLQTVLLG
jgi:hypothetical protein